MAEIGYSLLEKALGRLREGLTALEREPENTLYRDAVIQRFEFTYSLCASMLKRYLVHAEAAALDNEMTFPALIRTASEYWTAEIRLGHLGRVSQGAQPDQPRL